MVWNYKEKLKKYISPEFILLYKKLHKYILQTKVVETRGFQHMRYYRLTEDQ